MLAEFDTAVIAAIDTLRSPALDVGMRAVTHLGDTVVLATASVALAGWLVLAARRREALLVALSLAVGLLGVNLGIKALVGRARPPVEMALIDQPLTASFPSGHAFGALLLVLLAIWVGRRGRGGPWWIVAVATGVAVALLVGISRVYLGVHWPSDIAGAWLLAAGWAGLTVAVARRLERPAPVQLDS